MNEKTQRYGKKSESCMNELKVKPLEAVHESSEQKKKNHKHPPTHTPTHTLLSTQGQTGQTRNLQRKESEHLGEPEIPPQCGTVEQTGLSVLGFRRLHNRDRCMAE